ncbi:MAG: hypothetical protein ALECFALPRED_000219 [Alectoria fallacina]|uniref:Uncharacterized protein n=1 Tax=Alectoria fallacina TaxID=1903189 RepID=A0A8H3EIT8_9LECA|nr:MAG: hypothetical protein ALECFALPRED_000219 [Alectoria fallacina]
MAGPTRRKWSPISLVKKLRHGKPIKAPIKPINNNQPGPISDEQEGQSNVDQVGQLYGRPNGQTNASQHLITPAPATTLVPLTIQHYVLTEHINGHPNFQSNHTFITVPSTISLAELEVHIWAALCARDEPNNISYIPYEAAVRELRVHWDCQARVGHDFPQVTVLCEGNLESVLMYLRERRGYDYVGVAVENWVGFEW